MLGKGLSCFLGWWWLFAPFQTRVDDQQHHPWPWVWKAMQCRFLTCFYQKKGCFPTSPKQPLSASTSCSVDLAYAWTTTPGSVCDTNKASGVKKKEDFGQMTELVVKLIQRPGLGENLFVIHSGLHEQFLVHGSTAAALFHVFWGTGPFSFMASLPTCG